MLELKPRRRWPGRLLLLAAIVVAIVVGASYSGRWEEILLFLHRTSFGYADPLFHKDASFFIFTLPVWKMLVDFVGIAMLLTFLATALTYVADRAMVLNARNRISLAPHVKAHLSVLLAIAMVAKAGDYMIQSWSLVYSSRGAVMGASYTDVHASLPVLHFLAIVSLVAAAIFLANIRYKGWRLPAIAIARDVPDLGLRRKSLPGHHPVVQGLAERDHGRIALHRQQHRGDALRLRPGQDDEHLQPGGRRPDRRRHQGEPVHPGERPPVGAPARARHLSADPEHPALLRVQGRGRRSLHDRRQVPPGAHQRPGTRPEQAAAAVEDLGQPASHLYARIRLRAQPGERSGRDGSAGPLGQGHPSADHHRSQDHPPQIYYGELGNDFVIVKTTSPEFDYAKGNTNVPATYEGEGGVPIGSWIRRLAFSFRFGTPKLLFSSSLTEDSRIMYLRTIKERVQALAPFLHYDKDPYLVMRDDGSLVWMWDAYTTSDRFPYSQPHSNGLNYMRNPIKVVIDAYDGKVTFYQIDGNDPMANAWGKVFPGLFTPGDQMPADLRRHMRYPEDMYRVQADVLPPIT